MDADKARALLQRAVDKAYEPYTVTEVAQEIADGRAQFVMGDDSIMVLSLHQHHDEKYVHVWLAAGDLEEIRGPLKKKAENWARSQGCKYATIEGRPGWVRALKDYSQVSVTVRKEL